MIESKIIEIGSIVSEFKEEDLLILFGSGAPPELRDISVIHEMQQEPHQSIVQGGTVKIGQQVYTIEKVGHMANKNFEELGHLSIYFKDHPSQELLPGAILVSPGVYPDFKVNDVIEFNK